MYLLCLVTFNGIIGSDLRIAVPGSSMNNRGGGGGGNMTSFFKMFAQGQFKFKK